MIFSSIKSRLTAWFFIIFAILFTALGIFLYKNINSILVASIDNHLTSEVQLLAGILELDREEHSSELSAAAVGEYARPLSGHYYQILSEDGKIIAISPSLSIVGTSLPKNKPSANPVYKITTGPGMEPLRTLSQSFDLPSGTVTIQAGESLEEVLILSERFRRILLTAFPLFFVLALAGVFIITGFLFRRVDLFSSRVEQITEKRLGERLETEGVESELVPLASSFNTMMGRIEESFERQKQFLADASHDLRTPTSVIKSQCDVTLSRERESGEYREALESIRNKADEMTGLIGKILKVSRLESGVFELERSETNLLQLLKDLKSSLSPKAEDRQIKLNLYGERFLLSVDREKIFEALSVIVDNAIIYNKPGGSVDIRLGKDSAGVFIAVSDTGTGIEKDKLKRIFDRFYRADESRGKAAGSGLGLAIAKAVVELHGGSIEAESEPGRGTTMKVILP